MATRYTQEELVGYSKKQLREASQKLGIEFVNGLDRDVYIKQILDKQGPAAAKPGAKAQQAQDAEVDDDEDDDVQVTSGASSGRYKVVGQKVSDVRKRLATMLNIGPEAEPRVNNTAVSETYVLTAGDRLEFVKKSGDKQSS